MITVTVAVNGMPVCLLSALRVESGDRKGKISHYNLVTGQTITHAYDAGAVVLAKKMLDTIVGGGKC